MAASLTPAATGCDVEDGLDLVVDVAVVGAGPAGTAAAIEARRMGLSVAVFDKARFPRPKCCGDGLTSGALRHLEELGVDPTSMPSWKWIDEFTLVTPAGRELAYRFPSGKGAYAAVARRTELDQALVQRARLEGAKIHEGYQLSAVDAGTAGGIRAAVTLDPVTTSDGAASMRIEADLIVAADGMWSPTRKLLGLGTDGYRGEWHAFRQYFTNVSPRASNELVVWFDPAVLPGYVWSFPLGDGAANVGFGIQRGGSHRVGDMKRRWSDLLSSEPVRSFLGPEARPEASHRAWPIPARLGGLPLAHGRVLFVGDAAAATDPMSGEGIGQALETGRLALHCFQRSGKRLDLAAQEYRRALSRGMIRDHALARSLSAVLARPLGAETSLRVTSSTEWTRRNFARWLFEDYPRATVFNPRRWGRATLNAAPPFDGREKISPNHDENDSLISHDRKKQV